MDNLSESASTTRTDKDAHVAGIKPLSVSNCSSGRVGDPGRVFTAPSSLTTLILGGEALVRMRAAVVLNLPKRAVLATIMTGLDREVTTSREVHPIATESLLRM